MSEEHSRPVEAEFSTSWDRVEEFYHRLFIDPRWGGEWASSMLDLIAELRKRNYDRKFRAELSRAVLILSRSREHVLRSKQPFIEFHRDVPGSTGMSVTYHEGSETKVSIEIDKIELKPEVETLLKRLLECSIS